MTTSKPSPGCITVDVGALARNWRAANEASGTATASAVVKADGYGLGIGPVVEALHSAGCRHFFVALADEAAALGQAARDADVYVLNGPMSGHASAIAAAGFIPVLNDLLQVSQWVAQAKKADRPLPAAIMIDTGMNRLGLNLTDVQSLAADTASLALLDIKLVMSHLACADDPSSDMNARQKTFFDEARSLLPDAPASLANSAGLFLGTDYHYDLTRPGVCLYGASPFKTAPAPFEPVVSVAAEIIQVRDVAADESIGYGATFTATGPMRTATIAAGYADGIFRTAGNSAFAVVNGTRVPYVGRVSMDLIVLDISALDARSVRPGAMVDLIGPGVSVDDLAHASGTIGYEVLTS
ncbi:MAG: alanine racemase [Candidatus Phaeomarinobacter sp.]